LGLLCKKKEAKKAERKKRNAGKECRGSWPREKRGTVSNLEVEENRETVRSNSDESQFPVLRKKRGMLTLRKGGEGPGKKEKIKKNGAAEGEGKLS